MDGMESSILFAAVALVIGLITGALLHRLFHAGSAKSRRLESKIDQLKDRHTHYQAEVSSHFSQTADLLARLNNNYRDIFNHLAKGAEILGNDIEFREHASNKKEPKRMKHRGKDRRRLQQDDYIDPPRDYAPKSGPEEKGTLSEDFGFKPKPVKSSVK